MSILDTVNRAKAHLREHGRVSLRMLKREFDLDDCASGGDTRSWMVRWRETC
jgi:hypothetical protein